MGNGKPNAKRRAGHTGWLQIGDRRYQITHQFRYRTTMTQNGRVVARGRGRTPVRAPGRLAPSPTEGRARLALGLLWFLFTLGRTGAISDFLSGVSPI